MTAPLLIRDFEPADAEAVIALNMRATDPDHPAGREYTAVNYPALLDIPNAFQAEGAFLVGTIDGDLVAMGSLQPLQGRVFELDYMRIAHHLHRHGLGRQMVAALEARAAALGAQAIILTASLDNAPAHALYLAIGFHETERTTTHFDSRTFHGIRYRKEVRRVKDEG